MESEHHNSPQIAGPSSPNPLHRSIAFHLPEQACRSSAQQLWTVRRSLPSHPMFCALEMVNFVAQILHRQDAWSQYNEWRSVQPRSLSVVASVHQLLGLDPLQRWIASVSFCMWTMQRQGKAAESLVQMLHTADLSSSQDRAEMCVFCVLFFLVNLSPFGPLLV